MSLVCYIGDEASAAGFRLCGADVVVPASGGEAAALTAARGRASLVLVAASVAARIPARDIARAELAMTPLMLIVPDLNSESSPPDLATRLRGQLGLEDPR